MNITYALPKEEKVCDAQSYGRLVKHLDVQYPAPDYTVVHDEDCDDEYYSEAVVFGGGLTRYVQTYGFGFRNVLLSQEESIHFAKEVLRHYGVPFCNRVSSKGGY